MNEIAICLKDVEYLRLESAANLRDLTVSEYAKLKVLDHKGIELSDISIESGSLINHDTHTQIMGESKARLTEDDRDVLYSILKRSSGYGVFLIDSEFSVELRNMALRLLRNEEKV